MWGKYKQKIIIGAIIFISIILIVVGSQSKTDCRMDHHEVIYLYVSNK